ncbi:hypothetical protein [Archaeoglobus neptunius]|uniref:hypothetical protein n=1 Tax=Archaeoglobus neptunius TaxID=2798580 RepID=UPI001928EF39|nr:hypothetical protein [Archaeoglobus neptunius]
MKKLYISVLATLLLSIIFVSAIDLRYISVFLASLLLLSLIFLPYDLKVDNSKLLVKYLFRKRQLEVKSMFPVDVRGVLRARLLGISAGKINFGLFTSTYGKVWVYTTDVDGVFVETDEMMFILDRGMVDDGCNFQKRALDA